MSDPTPEERADYIVRQLEQFIRDGRVEKRGMSLKSWQALARSEFVNAFRDIAARAERKRRDTAVRRLLVVASSTFVTIGFWGAMVAINTSHRYVAALVMLVMGIILAFFVGDFSVRRLLASRAADQRHARIARIDDFDRQLKRLEADMRRKRDAAKAAAEQGE